MKFYKILFLALLPLLLSQSVFADDTAQKKTETPQNTAEQDAAAKLLGKIENHIYSNETFNFKMSLPKDWYITEKDLRKSLSELGLDYVAGDDKNYREVLKSSLKRTFQLFQIFRYEVGKPVKDYNQNMTALIENIAIFPGVKKPEDYLESVKNVLKNSKIKATVKDGFESAKFGNLEFKVAESEISLGNAKIIQKFYATIIDRQVLVFGLNYTTPEQFTTLENVLKTIQALK